MLLLFHSKCGFSCISAPMMKLGDLQMEVQDESALRISGARMQRSAQAICTLRMPITVPQARHPTQGFIL
jgi:hypothetical protein